MKSLSAIIIITFFSAAVFAQAGELDSTFGGDGIVTTDIGTDTLIGNASVKSIAIQPDGKIVAAGYSPDFNEADFGLVRYNTDGTLDNSFGSNGIVITGIGNSSQAESVALQQDGRIVVAGSSATPYLGFTSVRYNTDGSIDSSFGNGGVAITKFDSMPCAISVAIQPDGKIVAAGQSHNGTTYVFAVVRYKIDGTLDSSFSTDGIVTTSVSSGDAHITSMVLQTDGKIVVVGNAGGDFALARYNANGSLDSTFSADGIVTTDIGSGGALSMALQSDGKIVASGFSYNGYDDDFALIRGFRFGGWGWGR